MMFRRATSKCNGAREKTVREKAPSDVSRGGEFELIFERGVSL